MLERTEGSQDARFFDSAHGEPTPKSPRRLQRELLLSYLDTEEQQALQTLIPSDALVISQSEEEERESSIPTRRVRDAQYLQFISGPLVAAEPGNGYMLLFGMALTSEEPIELANTFHAFQAISRVRAQAAEIDTDANREAITQIDAAQRDAIRQINELEVDINDVSDVASGFDNQMTIWVEKQSRDIPADQVVSTFAEELFNGNTEDPEVVRQHGAEAFLYLILNRDNWPNWRRRILSDAQAFPFGFTDIDQSMFAPDASVWEINGSWIRLPLADTNQAEEVETPGVSPLRQIAAEDLDIPPVTRGEGTTDRDELEGDDVQQGEQTRDDGLGQEELGEREEQDDEAGDGQRQHSDMTLIMGTEPPHNVAELARKFERLAVEQATREKNEELRQEREKNRRLREELEQKNATIARLEAQDINKLVAERTEQLQLEVARQTAINTDNDRAIATARGMFAALHDEEHPYRKLIARYGPDIERIMSAEDRSNNLPAWLNFDGIMSNDDRIADRLFRLLAKVIGRLHPDTGSGRSSQYNDDMELVRELKRGRKMLTGTPDSEQN